MTTNGSEPVSDYSPHRRFVFGEYAVDLERGGLTRCDQDISLRPKTFAVLRYLVERAGQLVARDELLSAVWPGVVVTDGSIDQCVIELRKALGDEQHTIIRTVPRRGLIFDVPVEFEHAAHPLQKRPPTVLRHWAVAVGIFAIVSLLIWTFKSFWLPVNPVEPIVSNQANNAVAVLPFEDLSPFGDQQYLADGISEEILDQLAQVPGLTVIARTSSFLFKGSSEDLRSIADRLDVSYLLEGSVRMDGDRVVITAQLVDASEGRNLWGQVFERRLDDIFDAKLTIAKEVTRILQAEARGPTRFSAHHKPDSRAYLLVLEGQALYRQRAPGDMRRAADLFRRATEIDPYYAVAWARLAAACRVLFRKGEITYEQLLREGLPATTRALELRPDLAEVQFRASNYAWIIGDFENATAYENAAQRLDPNHPLLLEQALGRAMFWGDMQRAIDLSSQLVRRDPLSPQTRRRMFAVLYFAGRFDEMTEEAAIVKRLFPDGEPDFVTESLVLAAIVKGDYEDAISKLDGIPSGMSRDHILTLMAGQPGHFEAAANAMQRLESMRSVEAALRLAEAYAWQGDREAAFKYLGVALERFEEDESPVADLMSIAESRISHFLTSLHDDARWESWLMNMPFQDLFTPTKTAKHESQKQ